MKQAGRREFLCDFGKLAMLGLAAPTLSFLFSGCKTLSSSTGSDASPKKPMTYKNITPEHEYYIGRAVGASILGKYKPYGNQKANRYVNLLGQTLARASDLPETFGGYHFLILDSDQINVFSAPGGLIFPTRGLLRCCPSEAAAAAALAHEIGHVQHRHGLTAIEESRMAAVANTLSGQVPAPLFQDCVSDIVATLTEKGYPHSQEFRADETAVEILRRVGYDPNGLAEMLNRLKTGLKPGTSDLSKTHPDPAERLARATQQAGGPAPVKSPASRRKRFKAALKNI